MPDEADQLSGPQSPSPDSYTSPMDGATHSAIGESNMPDETEQSYGLGAIATTQSPSPESYISEVGGASSPVGGASGLSTPARIPAALLCARNQAWHWPWSTGTGITDHYSYELRFALYAWNLGYGQLVWVIDQIYPSGSHACELLNTWISTGTVAVQGSQIIFNTQGQRRQTDSCSSSRNGTWPISGQTVFGWSLDQTRTKLFLVLPFAFAGFTKIICTKVTF